ncbi:MAG: class I SAM-dependent methyltransferase [Xenococcaceae cyanobacterium]
MSLTVKNQNFQEVIKTFLKENFPEFSRSFDKFHLAPDRQLLENVIFPYFVDRTEFQKVLFVGCEWYSKPYNKYFKNKEYWTIEIDPKRRKYGAKNHVTDSIANLKSHFKDNYFDLIIFNGVFYAENLEQKQETEDAFSQCHQTLDRGGVLVLGWNDTDEILPFPLEKCESLQKFQPYFFAPLSTAKYLTTSNNRHTYSFYQKN